MGTCPAAVTAGAIFTALVVRDIYLKLYKDIPFHLVGGIFSVFGLYTLCEVGNDTVAWAVFLVPFFALIVGFYIQWAEGHPTKPAPAPAAAPCPVCAPQACGCPRRKRCSYPPQPEGPSVAPLPSSVTTVKPNPKPSSFGCPVK